MKVGEKFKGEINNKYDNLYKPFKSYVINQEGIIISTHPTPIEAIKHRNKVNPNYKLHFSKKQSVMNLQELKQAIENSNYLSELDFHYIIKNIDVETDEDGDIENLEEIREKIQQAIYETEVIYYSVAMEFLTENDTSLSQSLEIASELGFSPENLNSETLATLLKQQMMSEELSEIN